MNHTRGDWSHLLRLPRRFLAGVVASALVQAVTLIGFILLIRLVVDRLGAEVVSADAVKTPMIVLVVVVLVNAGARFGEFWFAENMGYELVRGLRMAMYAHLQGMTPRQVQGRARGGLLLRFTGDLSMLRTWVSRGIGRGLASVLVVGAGVVTVATLDLRLAMAMLAVYLVGAAVTIELGPELRRVTKWVRRKRSLLTSNVDEQVHALAVVQVFGRSRGEYQRLSRQNDSMTRSLFKTSSIRGRLLAVGSVTSWLSVVAVLWLGSVGVLAGRISLGTVTAALLAARHLAGPARRIALSYDYWQRARVSRDKILDFMVSSSRELDADGAEPLRVRSGLIELRGLGLGSALRTVDATIQGGSLVAIMGPSGAGKSTLLSIVSGLEEPDRGEVLIDGQSLEHHSVRSRFQKVGVVSPDLPLMRGTIARNLTYRRRNAADSEVRRVVAVCRLEPLLRRLPDGAQTWIYEGGRNLSVGERQRIALARALIGNPPILLLDEPSTGLDPETKAVVREVLRRYHGTVLLVTHDPDEASIADEVWRMEDGRIVEVMPGGAFRERRWLRDHRELAAF